MQNRIFILVSCGMLVFSACRSQKQVIQSQEIDSEAAYVSFYTDALKFQHIAAYNRAEENYRNAIHFNAKAADSYFGLFEVYNQRKMYNEALVALQHAISLNPQNAWYLFSKVRFFDKHGTVSDLVLAAEALVSKFPGNDSYQIILAQSYMRNKQLQKATAVLEAIVPKITDNEEIYSMRLELANKLQDKHQEEQLLKELYSQYPNNISYGGMLAEFYLNAQRYSKANETYELICAQFPKSLPLQFSRVSYYLQVDSVALFEKHFASLVSTKEASPEAKLNVLFNLFINYKGKVGIFKRETWLFDAAVMHPNYAPLLHFATDNFIASGQKDKAALVMAELVKNGTTDFNTFNKLIMLHIESKEYTLANTYSEKALELYPNQATLYLLNGVSLFELGKYIESIDYLQNGKMLVLDNTKLLEQFYYYLAEASHKLNRNADSDKYFEQLLVLNSNNYVAMNNFAYYLTLENRSLDKAKSLAQRCTQANPNSFNYLDTHAWVLYNLGEFSEALIIIEQALKYGGSVSATILEHYGDILFKLNRTNDATMQWRISLKLNNNNPTLSKKIENNEK